MRRQPIIVFLISLLCLLVACGVTPPPPPDPPEEKLVTGTLRAVPDLAVYREVTEPDWKPLPMITPTTFQFAPKGPYLVTVVCEEVIGIDRFPFVQQFAQTPDDPGYLDVWCDHQGPHHVTGSIIIPPVGLFLDGGMSMGYVQIGPRVDFDFPLARGTYDLLAHVHGRIATRRGIEVLGDTSMPPLDLDRETVLAITPGFSVSNLAPMEQISWITVDWLTQGASLNFYRNNKLVEPIPLAPNSALLPADVQTMALYTQSGQSRRGVQRKFREGDSPVLTLPDRMDSVTLSQADGRPTATWAALPDHDGIRAQVNGLSADPSTRPVHVMKLSRSFEDAMGVSSIAADSAIPGYLSRWQIDISKQYYQEWLANREVGNDTLMSGTAISVNVPAMPIGSLEPQSHDLHRRPRALHAP